MGYVQHAGGGWTGDVELIDWESCEEAEHASEIYEKRLKNITTLNLLPTFIKEPPGSHREHGKIRFSNRFFTSQ